ncbi:NADH oxidase [bioreactor metagenome]|uniref:NADH oxidase n=1 Tax=bioreactor metagenome TaxID=1076179 RepID=A0A644XEC6_9ZZZZ
MKKLFEPGKIGRMTVKNRAVMAPMQVLYGEIDGHPGPRIIHYYEERARGGVGLIIVEATAVDETNNTPWEHQLRLTRDCFISDFGQLTEAIHKYDCRVFVQLHHYGAKSAPTPSGAPWAVSDIPAMPGGKSPHRMTAEEIKTLEDRFVAAAVRAKKAGFDGVELAGAHGYLLAQFLSPYYNDRTDLYGGTPENRCRIYTEIIESIHGACGRDYPVCVRFPGDEFTPQIPKTLTAADCPEIARILEGAGADVLSVSNGNNFNASANCEPYYYEPGWKKHVAKAVKDAVSIPVIATNTIKDPEFAEQMLEEGVCDFVALGRALIADPMFMKKAAKGDTLGIRKCMGCMFCREQLYAQLPIQCALNPRVGCEYVYPAAFEKDGAGRRVAVIGGGPAGMEAALVLQSRGFSVTLFEADSILGGTMNLADKGYQKEKVAKAAQTMAEELRRLGVELRLGEAATLQAVKAMSPAGVVIACGALPVIPKVEGADRQSVVTSHDVISGRKVLLGRVAIVGAGMTGLECAEKLCLEGCRVSLIDIQPKVGVGAFSIIVDDLMRRISPCEPEMYLGHALDAVTERGVLVKDLQSGEKKEIAADYVVFSLGVRPKDRPAKDFAAAFEHVLSLGDCAKSGRIPQAVKDAYTKSLVFLK